jgi:hypothetical protein
MRRSLDPKSFIIPGFTLDETIRYLSEFGLSRSEVEDMHRLSKGIPGYLSSIGRLFSQARAQGKPLTELPDSIAQLFEREWDSLRSGDAIDRDIVAVLVHDRRTHTVDTLAALLGKPGSFIAARFDRFSFLSVDPETKQVAFVSEGYRRFAAKTLFMERAHVIDLVINELLSDPESHRALLYLPSYLHEAGRLDELLEYLSPDHIGLMVESSRSWKPIELQTTLGIAAAKQVRRDSDLVRLGIQGASISDFEEAETWRAEVEAKMALGLDEAAFAIAQATIADEDRLHLLAAIARAKKQQKRSIEPELEDQIRQLFDRIDKEKLGLKGIEIAAELVFSHPDLAIQLVQASTAGSQADEVPDLALARFSLSMIGATAATERQQDALTALRKELQNPRLKSFSATFSVLFGNYSADEVIAEVKDITGAENQISLLRQWCRENRDNKDAARVVNYALDLVIKATDYSPNARVYREIATPLPGIEGVASLRELVSRFNGQRGTTLRLGSTVEHVRFDMLLARAEWKYDRAASTNRLTDTYLSVSDIADASVRTACYAHLYSTLRLLDPRQECEAELKLHSSTRKELESGLQSLLSKTARQFQVTEHVIKTLAKIDVEWAAELAQKLNTHDRRDRALEAVITSRSKSKLTTEQTIHLLDLQSKISSVAAADDALLEILYAIAADSARPKPDVDASRLLEHIELIRHAGQRCRAYSLLIAILQARGETDEIDAVYTRLRDTWEAIDLSWFKVETAYNIISALAEHSKERAKAILNKVEFARQELRMTDRATANSYWLCLKLVIRAFSGLLAKRNAAEQDYKNVETLIAQIPSCGARAQLFSELAVAYFLRGRSDEGSAVVTDKVKPLLGCISELDADYRAWVVVSCAAALYCAHKGTAFDFINTLDRDSRDQALNSICTFIFEKVSPSEPFEGDAGYEYDVTFEEIRDICDLVMEISSDVLIYGSIRQIADTIVSAQRHHKFSQQQISDISRRISEITAKKFQHPDYITHEGYVIIAEAHVARIKNEKWPIWEQLVRRAKCLPNVADMAYVLAVLAAALPSKYRERRVELLKAAKSAVETIPADIDRIGRLEILAHEAIMIDPAFGKECLKAGVVQSVATNEEEEEVEKIQRRLIDLAYKIEPEFAADLASFSDTDPAKREKFTVIQTRLETLEVRQKMLHNEEVAFDRTTINRYISAANVLRAQLSAGKVGPRQFDDLRPFVEIASRAPLRRSYPILQWIFANVVKKYENTLHAARFIRPLFDASVLAAELALRIATNSLATTRVRITLGAFTSDERSILVRPGEREKALTFLREWLERNLVDYIKICDAWFAPADLELVKLLRETNRKAQIEILTSKRIAEQECRDTPIEQVYQSYWRMRVSSDDPGDTTITVVGTKDGSDFPIHDRWWLTRGAGLRVGTSFGSLGVKKESEISVLDSEQSRALETEVNAFLTRQHREFEGRRLIYHVFSLE